MIVDIVFGFLGAGKTTFITKVLREWGERERIVVLVNEFGEAGIDGALLKGQGGNVVEMPSGCICCTLQADFRTQILEIFRTVRPERMIIEPTGVATIGQVSSVVHGELFQDFIEVVRHVLIADATDFMALYKANRYFVESQVKNAGVVLLNKCDRVETKAALVTKSAIAAINPDTTVLMTSFGAVDWAEYQLALSTSHSSGMGGPGGDATCLPAAAEPFKILGPGGGPSIHLDESQNSLGYESAGLTFKDVSFDLQRLEAFFQQLQTSQLGEVVRAKGIFRVGERSVLMELASGELSFQPVRQSAESKVSIIGKHLDKARIGQAVGNCLSEPAPHAG